MVQLVRHAAFSSQRVAPRQTRVRHMPVLLPCLPSSLPYQARLRCRATAPNQPAPEAGLPDEEFVGIPPEEDAEVPGTYLDALNPQTKLGKAVRAAVDELNHLNALEMETLQQADSLLKKLGIKTSILQAPQQPSKEDGVEEPQEV